jgi:hypothetical protein
MEGQVVRAAPIDPADQPAQRVPRHVHLLEDRLLIFGGFANVRSLSRRSRGFPFPTLMVSSWLVVSPTLWRPSFSFGASRLSAWLPVSSSKAGSVCILFASILLNTLILKENRWAATTGKHIGN